jgi:hypothetical protein
MAYAGVRAELSVALCLAVLLGAQPAHSAIGIRSDCRSSIGASPAISDPLTARWYKRFWTGSCDGLGGCISGSPNWNDVVGKLVARGAPAQRQRVLTEACRLGPLIGLEWTRPRAVRRINTDDLQGFQRTLESSPDVLHGIEAVTTLVRGKLER